MKISFIATVFNEEKTIIPLLDSLRKQTHHPNEIIISDGGSVDNTRSVINSYSKTHRIPLTLIRKSGNRAVGRNAAVLRSTGSILLFSDAGCILDKNWCLEIAKPFKKKNVSVVAGFYKGKAKTIFQRCLIPYVLVMPDKIGSKAFLPSTRSMAIRRVAWKKAGGFPEEYSHNEDYVFAKTLQRLNMKMYFAKEAIVYWLPRNTLKSAFTMFFRFALGDAEAGIFRAKVLLIFLRYTLLGVLTSLAFNNSFISFYLVMSVIALYFIWAIMKNYRYVRALKAIFFLPLLQITSDTAVLIGSSIGLIRFLEKRNLSTSEKK